MNAAPPPARASSTSPRLVYGAGASAALVAALLVGWLTPLRGVMHALFITLVAHALIPFLFVLGIIALIAAGSLTTALMAQQVHLGSAALGNALGGKLGRAYYEHIQRQHRHPLAWGLGVGLALGVVGTWLVLAALVVPLETRTLGILLLAEARIDAARHAEPAPAAPPSTGVPSDGLLYPAAWSGPGSAKEAPVLDAFGHAISHAPGAATPGTGYILRSVGLDGVPSADDLCVAGGTTPADPRHDPLQFLEDLRADRLGWSSQVSALAKARCNTGAR